MSSPSVECQGAGGPRELLHLALPLVLSNSFMTLQITADRVLLSPLGSDTVAASMGAAMLFWTPMVLLQQTAGYAATFVSQYVGAGRNLRVGPSVWQGLYLALAGGLAFLLLLPAAESLVALSGHSDTIQAAEVVYFNCLCFAALPMALVAAVSAFFAGRGDTWPVLWVNAAGTVVNVVLDYAWIGGNWGFPAWGIAGAGWATVLGSWVSALVGLAWFARARFREEYATLDWRPEWPLLGRLLYFGVPNGLQFTLDVFAFTIFVLLMGRVSDAAFAASSIAFTINAIAFIPMLGLGQAVAVLVGQRLGQDRPDLAERTTHTGGWMCWVYMSSIAAVYVLLPGPLTNWFRDPDATRWQPVAEMTPVLLRFVALYSVFESLNLIYSSALRGAGDTRVVTLISLGLAYTVMVVPSVVAVNAGWGALWPWGFATTYVVVLALCMAWRFRLGRWKDMRVIEPAPADLAA